MKDVMMARDFVGVEDFERIHEAVSKKEAFKHEKILKNKDGKITLSLYSGVVDEDTAEKIWNGNNYLVHLHVMYHGKRGIGGQGSATDKYERFETWENLKSWIDDYMRKFDTYDTEEYGQTSLF